MNPTRSRAGRETTTTATAQAAVTAPAPHWPRPRYVLASQIAAYCAVDLKTVHNWTDEGRLKCFRTPGGHRRYRAQDVVAFLVGAGWQVPASVQALATVEAQREAADAVADAAAAEAILAQDGTAAFERGGGGDDAPRDGGRS